MAASTGTLEIIKRTALTFSEFVRTTFEQLYMPKYRPATRVRYKALFGRASPLRSVPSGSMTSAVRPSAPTAPRSFSAASSHAGTST